MVFNKQAKQAFVFPPKNGTHTTQNFLISLGWKQIPKAHALTQTLIDKYSNLNYYVIYGFLRDPLQRFESAILYVKQNNPLNETLNRLLQERGIADSVESVSYETMISIFPFVNDAFPTFFKPQSAWLDHPKVTVLDFRNMEAELRRITGNTEQPLVRYNTSTDFGRSVITPAVEEFVRQQYADDYKLANKKGIIF